MGHILEKFNKMELNANILALHSNNHARRSYIRTILTKDFLSELISDGCSINHICLNILKPRGIQTQPIHLFELCKEFEILTMTCKKQANTQNVKDKRSQTAMQRYGVSHVMCKGTKFYNKRDKTVWEKYGVDNVFQTKEVQLKIEQTCLSKYGVKNSLHFAWEKANGGRRSKPHKKVEEYLKSIGVEFISECMDGRFKKFNKFTKSDYSPIPDIVVDGKKVVIEIYGDIWHANPKKYKSTDLVYKYGGPITAHDIRIFDRARKKQIESFGYKVIILWELDINRNFDSVKELLLKELQQLG